MSLGQGASSLQPGVRHSGLQLLFLHQLIPFLCYYPLSFSEIDLTIN